MLRPRIIPVLLLKNRGLVKSVKFKDHRYIGDPINAVRIFNEARADELIFLDIDASRERRQVSTDFIASVGEEACMPFAIGGGIRSIADIGALINAGAEKVVIGTAAGLDPDFVSAAADRFGSTTVAVCIDVKRKFLSGQRTWVLNGSKSTPFAPEDFARLMEKNGAGELIIQSIERDGSMTGYDTDLVRAVAAAVSIPVVALGGAGSFDHLIEACRDCHASAAAAGSMFVFQGRRRGVLINYPDRSVSDFD